MSLTHCENTDTIVFSFLNKRGVEKMKLINKELLKIAEKQDEYNLKLFTKKLMEQSKNIVRYADFELSNWYTADPLNKGKKVKIDDEYTYEIRWSFADDFLIDGSQNWIKCETEETVKLHDKVKSMKMKIAYEHHTFYKNIEKMSNEAKRLNLPYDDDRTYLIHFRENRKKDIKLWKCVSGEILRGKYHYRRQYSELCNELYWEYGFQNSESIGYYSWSWLMWDLVQNLNRYRVYHKLPLLPDLPVDSKCSDCGEEDGDCNCQFEQYWNSKQYFNL